MKKWELKDVIMVGIISIVFGVIYLAAINFASLVLKPLFATLGLAPFTYEVVFGVWFMASTLAAYIMQKAGVALISEVIAAVLEVLMGNLYGPVVIVSGIVQGLGAELGFTAYKYRRFDFKALCVSSILAAVFSFTWGMYRKNLFLVYPSYFVLLLLVVRIISAVIFSAVLVKIIGDGLKRSGVLNSYPIAK